VAAARPEKTVADKPDRLFLLSEDERAPNHGACSAPRSFRRLTDGNLRAHSLFDSRIEALRESTVPSPMSDFSDREKALAQRAIDVAGRERWGLVTAESCSAGLLAACLSGVPGAGECLHGGIVAYTKMMKHAVLGVPERMLSEKTAVCAAVAHAMADGAVHRTPADAAIAITGVAGPEPDEDGNAVGLMFIAVVTPRGAATKCLELGSRSQEAILSDAICAALELFVVTAQERAA
jgi:PncC family amidohydrolase